MTNIKALLLTILVGIFFLVGLGITRLTKKKKELTLFATGLSFIVMMSMILFDIIPEIGENVIELENGKKWMLILGCTILGMALLKGLDMIIPHHHHEHKEQEKNKKEHEEHLFHIGFVTSLSLMLHNMIEGMSIYITTLSDFKTGVLMMLAVSLHNIPLGMEIAVGLESSKTKKKTTVLTILLLTISSFLGALILFLLNHQMSKVVLAGFLCVTFGMLLYIALFELLKEIWMNRKRKPIYYGMALGVMISVIMVII